MTLNSLSSHPNTRSYVLKLHRDALPSAVHGRLEHMDSGRCFDFASAEELVAYLIEELRAGGASTEVVTHSTATYYGN